MRRLLVAYLTLFLIITAAPAVAAGHPASFADLAAKALPAVVNVSTSQDIEVARVPGMAIPQFPPGSPFENLFKEFFEHGLPPGMAPPEDHGKGTHRQVTSLGSGFIISADGLVVTNNHVIAHADEITVLLSDDTELKATIVGRDKKTDLALLKVKASKPLPYIKWGDSDKVRVGDWVLAIGNPFGLGGTVTSGIVSARARDINAGPYDDFIQTDASINRGNSGGPMLDMEGEIVGINTAIFSPSGGSVGIGFSIPSNLAHPVIQQLKEFGRTKRGWLGVRIQEVTKDLADSLGLKKPTGALVASVNEEGPAVKAGVRPGDVIIKFNGKAIKEMRNLPRIVADTPVEEKVRMVVVREGKRKELTVVLGELEKAEDEKLLSEELADTKSKKDKKPDTTLLLGLRLTALTDKVHQRFRIPKNIEGVLVAGVEPESEAAEKALRAGDVILQVGYQSVATPGDVKKQIDRAKKRGGNAILMRVISRGAPRFVVLKIKK